MTTRLTSRLAGLLPLLLVFSLVPVAPILAQHATYSGSGDDVVQLDKPNADQPALLTVQGNRQGRHFAVVAHTQNRTRIGALVNTTEPYSGVVAADLPPRQNTALLEISAVGSWTIEVYPIGAAQRISVPGSFNGSGDNVLWVDGNASQAVVNGNSAGRHFAVVAYDKYGNRQGAIVNTTSSYEGTVLMPQDALLLEISAVGSWSIRLE